MSAEQITDVVVTFLFGVPMIALMFKMNGSLGHLTAEDKNLRHKMNNVEQVQNCHGEKIEDHSIRISVLESRND